MKQKKKLFSYWHYVKPHLLSFICGPILMIVEVVGEVVMPSLLSEIIDVGVQNKDISYILAMGGTMVLTALLMMAGGVGGAWFASKASIGFASDLRRDMFSRIQDFTFSNVDQFSTGSLITRLTNDVTQLQMMVNMCLRMMLRSPGMLVGALIMSVRMNPSLSVVLAVVIPLLIAATVVVLIKAAPKFNRMQEKLDGVNASIRENITNVRVVKSFVREDLEIEKFDSANSGLRESTMSAMRLMITTMPIMTLLMNMTSIAVVWLGGNQVIAGEFLVGDLTAFCNYVTQILMSLMMTSMIFMNLSRAMASAKRVRQVMETIPEINDDLVTDPELCVKNGTITFENVSFRYYADREENVLENLNFTIDAGETVGIIGSTGCGKTSLVQLIPRLYDANEGRVLIDGVDVKHYPIQNLRKSIGMVLQKNLLFSGSVKENLLWGNEDAIDEEIRLAAKAAQADGFVSEMEKGYDSFISRGGNNVSGGQKQRLCIARALLKKPKILILDDSTSAVDTATEARIKEAFANELKDATKIIIAQRISSVKDADRIFVLGDGEIVGVGSHEQLLKTNETYQEIFESQESREEALA